MPGSALIFVLIIAIWAACVLQSWARRRQHLATVRNVDRFSTAMRVLQRRAPLPQAEVVPPAARSYAVTPTRPATPEVTVKRASIQPSRPSSFARAGHGVAAVSKVSATRWRALLLTLSLVCVAALAPLAVIAMVPWWAPVIAGGVMLLTLAWGVVAAKRAARRKRLERLARGRTARPVPAELVVERRQPVAAATPADGRRARREFFDVEAPVASAIEPVAPAPVEAPESTVETELPKATQPEVVQATQPGAWQPVAVPRPTYTMKAKVRRPETPAAELPFDGNAMALDVEDEELPAVYKAV